MSTKASFFSCFLRQARLALVPGQSLPCRTRLGRKVSKTRAKRRTTTGEASRRSRLRQVTPDQKTQRSALTGKSWERTVQAAERGDVSRCCCPCAAARSRSTARQKKAPAARRSQEEEELAPGRRVNGREQKDKVRGKVVRSQVL
jgi:hypothetical protein